MHITYLIQFHVMSLLLNHLANYTIENVALYDSLHFKRRIKGGTKLLVLFLSLPRGDEIQRKEGAKFKVWSLRSLYREGCLNKTPEGF